MRFDFSGAADLLETLFKMPELVSIGNAVQRNDFSIVALQLWTGWQPPANRLRV